MKEKQKNRKYCLIAGCVCVVLFGNLCGSISWLFQPSKTILISSMMTSHEVVMIGMLICILSENIHI